MASKGKDRMTNYGTEALDNTDKGQTKDRDDETDIRCGFGSWRPRCCQRFATVNWATALLSVCAMFSLLIRVYLATSVSTLEKRYELKSQEIGIAGAIQYTGSLIGSIVITYFCGGRTNHRPRWIAGCIFVVVIGAFIICLPQFIFGPYEYSSVGQNTTQQLCFSNHSDTNCDEESTISDDNRASFGIIISGQFLVGLVANTMISIGLAYIDDSVSKVKAPFYFGIVYAVMGFGPLFGFYIGATVSTIWVDFGKVDTATIPFDEEDPRWVGAWWLGLLIAAFLYLFVALMFLFLPKRLPQQIQKSKTDEARQSGPKDGDEEDIHEPNTLKTLPRATKSMFTSVPYWCLVIAHIFESATFSGYSIFLAKYIEQQFSETVATSNIITGTSTVFSGTFGVFLGGFILRRWKLGVRGAVNMIIVCLTVAAILITFFVAFHCDNVRLAGVNVPYFDNVDQENLDLQSSCNDMCNCNQEFYAPICATNGLTYFSPCYAGCQETANTTFSSCTCITNSTSEGTDAVDGECARNCSNIMPFAVILASISFCVFLPQPAYLMIVVRSIKPDLKAYGIGLRAAVGTLIGDIPAPIIYGTVIDSVCILWNELSCGGGEGQCWMYDLRLYRYKFIGLTFCLYLAIAITFIILAVWLKRKRKKEQDNSANGKFETTESPVPGYRQTPQTEFDKVVQPNA
ncbi:solute carrier organic anion transporter family member 3A1-like [Glandiceps talaboti]